MLACSLLTLRVSSLRSCPHTQDVKDPESTSSLPFTKPGETEPRGAKRLPGAARLRSSGVDRNRGPAVPFHYAALSRVQERETNEG